MPLPPAHFLVGSAAAELANSDLRLRRGVVWVVGGVFGMLPDIDKGIGVLLGEGAAYRGIFTHSTIAVLTVATLVWLVAGRRAAAIAGVAYGSHLLLDPFEDRRGEASAVQPLWPFSEATVVAPEPILPSVPWRRGDGVEGAAASLLHPEVFPWLVAQTVVAAAIFVLALLLSWLIRRAWLTERART